MIVERKIYTIIKEGIEWFKADPNRVYEFLVKRAELEPEEARKVQDYFSMDPDDPDHWGGPPTVMHGYPRYPGPLPCYCLVLMDDGIKNKFLGDDGGTIGDEEEKWTDLDGEDALPQVKYSSYRFEIGVYVYDNPDICVYYYHLLRFMLFDRAESFHELGISNVEFTGRDVAPDPKYLPENIWARVTSLTVETEEWASDAKGPATSVSGLTVGDGITTYTTE